MNTLKDGGPVTRSGALLKLINAANDLNSIVEGVPSVRWANGSMRLKDTREWCAFYCALADINNETARSAMLDEREKPEGV
jgi:hypothetical protein